MKFLIIISTFIISSLSFADTHGHHKGHKHPEQKVTSMKVKKSEALIKVQGMVCAFCAQGVKKNFGTKPEVKSVDVDLDKMEVLVKFHPGKTLSEQDMKKIITGAGFKFVGVN